MSPVLGLSLVLGSFAVAFGASVLEGRPQLRHRIHLRCRSVWRRLRPVHRKFVRESYEDLLAGHRVAFGYGVLPQDWRALEKLAARDGYCVECVGYSGLLDYELRPKPPKKQNGETPIPTDGRVIAEDSDQPGGA
jgi:hypothetical protein